MNESVTISSLTSDYVTQSLLGYVDQVLRLTDGGNRSLRIVRTENVAATIAGQDELIDLEVGIQKHPDKCLIDPGLQAFDRTGDALRYLISLLDKALWADTEIIAKAVLEGLKPLGTIHVIVADEDSVIFAFSNAATIVMMHRKPN